MENLDIIIESFHLLWDSFPERVRLIKKDRTVLAVNPASEREGFVEGVRCIDTPPKEAHAGCLANKALTDKVAQHALSVDGKRMRYWIPVTGSDDLFIHFSIPKEIIKI